MDMERIIALYMDDCHSRQLRPKTMQSYEQALKLFSTWLAETHAVTQVEAVKDIHIRSYINDLQTRGKLIQRLGLKNTWWALWLPWASGGQVMGMYLCRTFIAGQPASVFESARIDGAPEFKAFYMIAFPLTKPILATLVVMNMISLYSDFIWPLLVIDSNSKQVISVAIQTYSSSQGTSNYGAMMAGFVIATVPLLLMFSFSSRLYIEGITSGAVKA